MTKSLIQFWFDNRYKFSMKQHHFYLRKMKKKIKNHPSGFNNFWKNTR